MLKQPTTLREKAAQLIFIRIGSNMPPAVTVAEDAERIASVLARVPLGGLVLFNGTTADTPAALAKLQSQSTFPLLIGADMERGAGQQLQGGTVFPHVMAFEATGTDAETFTESAAAIAAREALACGVHITFSPVADVNSDPRNPIIATRAYSADAASASTLASAFIRSTAAEGLLTTAKHFPGHGNTHQDSHDVLATVDSDRATLDAVDLAPFRAAIAAGVDLIMTAHVAFPALADAETPATASPRILRTLLRDELGFEGVVVSDSLLMGGIRDRYADAGAQAVALVEAGVDILLDVDDPEAALNGLVTAVETGTLDAAYVETAFERVWALKEKLAAKYGADVFVTPPTHPTAAPEALEEAATIARRACTIHSRSTKAWHLDPEKPVLVVLLKPNRTRMDPPEEPLGEALRARFKSVDFHELGPETDEAAYTQLAEAARNHPQVLVAMIVKPAAWHRFGLLPAQQQFVKAVAALPQVRLASLGVPYILDQFPTAHTTCCTWSDVAVSQVALADLLIK